jgi:hypothetical protein
LTDEHCLKKPVIETSDALSDGEDYDEDESDENVAAALEVTTYLLSRLRDIEHVEITGLNKTVTKATVAKMQRKFTRRPSTRCCTSTS